jgi:hypothetical protein
VRQINAQRSKLDVAIEPFLQVQNGLFPDVWFEMRRNETRGNDHNDSENGCKQSDCQQPPSFSTGCHVRLG